MLRNAELDGDNVKGLDKQIKKLIESESSSFLFDSDNQESGLTGVKPHDGSGKPLKPLKSTDEMTYTEMCAYIEANPDAKL